MKIVLAYSGGLDTSVILRWLRHNYDAQIVAFCADIGQEEELEGLEEKARRTGAMKCIIEDLREEFARDFVFPMFQAGGILRRAIFSRHQHRPSLDCEANSRDRARGGGGCHRARGNWKGE